jgi:hypothetical protein
MEPVQQPFETFTLLKVPQYVYNEWKPVVDTKGQKNPVGEIEVHTLPNGTQEYYLILQDNRTVPPTELKIPLSDVKKPQNIPFTLFLPKQTSPNEPTTTKSKGSMNDDGDDDDDDEDEDENEFSSSKSQYNFQGQLQAIKEVKIPYLLHQDLIKQKQLENERKHEESRLHIFTREEARQFDHDDDINTRLAEWKRLQNEDLSLKASTTKEKRFRQNQEDVLSLLFELSKHQKYNSIDDMVKHTNQPKQYLTELVQQYCTKVVGGEFNGKYVLTSLYNQGNK